jgi:hypothetical protein
MKSYPCAVLRILHGRGEMVPRWMSAERDGARKWARRNGTGTAVGIVRGVSIAFGGASPIFRLRKMDERRERWREKMGAERWRDEQGEGCRRCTSSRFFWREGAPSRKPCAVQRY